MRRITGKDLVIICSTLLVILILTILNQRVALRRSRDFQRKDDLGNLSLALIRYREDFGFYPPSSTDGRIIACGKQSEVSFEKSDISGIADKEVLAKMLETIYRPCSWGQDSLRDISDLTYPAYLETIPGDPQSNLGVSYYYTSTYEHFQIFASLESADEDEYNIEIANRFISCGLQICNFGKSSPNTPLDKSLKEYENELQAKKVRE